MPCYHPITAYRSRRVTPAGKIPLTFDPAESSGVTLQVPCGRCIGCRLDRVRDWTDRLMLEHRHHDEAIFVTLTYHPDKLPLGGTLVPRHFTLFLKRLRKSLPQKIRFFHCGEYGSQLSRPHYHAIIYGYKPKDAILIKGGEFPLYTSPTLESIWGHGFITFGDVTRQSCAYVAGYVVKKINGEQAEQHYTRTKVDGTTYRVHPEYVTMSRRPGIASQFYEDFSTDIYPLDNLIVDGARHPVPKIFDRKLDKDNPSLLQSLKARRKKRARKSRDNTPERLRSREQFAILKTERKTRSYEA